MATRELLKLLVIEVEDRSDQTPRSIFELVRRIAVAHGLTPPLRAGDAIENVPEEYMLSETQQPAPQPTPQPDPPAPQPTPGGES